MVSPRLALLLAAVARLAVAETSSESSEPTAEPSPEVPLFCPMDYVPVCGTDDQTYGNYCELQLASRTSLPGLEMDYEGECCHDRICMIAALGGDDTLNPSACASDRKYYMSACNFLDAQCAARQNLWLVPDECCTPGGAALNPLCIVPPPNVPSK